ncbi:response regulator transcription factor [Novosphingobium bradum]|uniref:Response regulator transcription factor n=1 Tax=Novosphingobium bradum TaxID=1737444 RepID=A0ABV7IP04_9SPHN
MSDIPENTKWSLNNAGLCGIRTFLRPCQSPEAASLPDSGFPLHPICKPDNETVYIVDDDEAFLEEAVEAVELFGHRVRGFRSGNELREIAEDDPTGCLLLDIKLPGQDGISIHEWIVKNGFALSVIYVSGTQDVGTVAHCMKAGAVEFIQKPFGEMALRNAIHIGIAQSRKMRCWSQSTQLVRALVGTLTPTELLVAQMIAKGFPTKSIASDMDRSENTVKIHRHRIFSKLKVNSTASVANILGQLDEAHFRSTFQNADLAPA